MKRKAMETGRCAFCGQQTTKKVPRGKGMPRHNNFYCGCKGARA